jgi:hypothetical protein
VVDTVGAGDAFTAGLAVGLLQGMALDELNLAANEVARHVCSCAGATPPLPAAVRNLFVRPFPVSKVRDRITSFAGELEARPILPADAAGASSITVQLISPHPTATIERRLPDRPAQQ